MGFTCAQVVRLYDTDEAGFLFFGSAFRFAHAALEEFLAHVGFPIAEVLRRGSPLFPVVHAEADYRAPLVAGDRLSVTVTVRALGERSFTLGYRLLLADGREAGAVTTVHAALDTATGLSCALPDAVREAFAPHLETGDRP